LYAEMARDCGLDVPATRHFELGRTLAAFGIERFDVEAGMRVPVHTLAGLLGADHRVPSSVDYTTFLRATRFLTRSQVEVNRAYGRAVFNVVFVNRDDHPKNVSYRLGRDGAWRLAPAYDLTHCTGPGGEHQMDVCGQGRDIGRETMLELAAKGGVDDAFAREALDRALAVAGTFAERAKRYPIRAATAKVMRGVIEAGRTRLG
jgi:serine/threonine-protein kinase HipA